MGEDSSHVVPRTTRFRASAARLHWLRKEYESAKDADKLWLAQQLLRRAEEIGDKAEAVRWRLEVAKRMPAAVLGPEEKLEKQRPPR